MRILALSDVHGSYKTAETILSLEETFDAVVVAGDLTTHGTPDEVERAFTILKRFGKPVLAVAGNMDPPSLEETFEKLGVSINQRATVLESVAFFGVSGSPKTPMRTP